MEQTAEREMTLYEKVEKLIARVNELEVICNEIILRNPIMEVRLAKIERNTTNSNVPEAGY